MRRTVALVGLVCTVAGCPARVPEVIDVRSVSRSSSAPRVESVADLGAAGVPQAGSIDIERGNGSGVIGELLLINGKHIGKQPTITIGGQPAEVVAHVTGGSVVARVPWGIDPGQVTIEVANRFGTSRISYPIKRLVVVATGNAVTIAELDAGLEIRTIHTIAVPGARKLAISTEGAMAFVGGGAPASLTIIDLTASPPRLVRTRQLPGKRVLDISTAAQVPVAVAVTDTHVVFIDERRPANPALYLPHELPSIVADAEALAATLSPRGRRLAIGLAERNRVALFDASDPTLLPAPTVIDALPKARLDVMQGLRFGPGGDVLWVVSGDNPRSIKGGVQPTIVSSIDLDGQGSVEPQAQIELEQAGAPLDLAAARGDPTPPGTAIRKNPVQAAAYVTTFPTELLRQGKPQLAGKGGRLLRTEPGKPPTVLAAGPWLLGSLDVVGKKQVVVAAGCVANGDQLTRVLVARYAWDDGQPRVLRLAPIPQREAGRALWFGEVRAQP